MNSFSLPSLKSSRLILTPPQAPFAQGVCDYHLRNQSHLQIWSPRVRKEFYTHEFQYKKIEQERLQIQERRLIKFWIFKQHDLALQRAIGHIAFSNIVWGAFRSCFLGYSMDFQETGRGYMTEALQTAIEFVFEELHLHRIEANIMPTNQASIRVVQKLNFEYEGRSPKYLKINGQWEDHLHYVIRNQALE